MLGGHGSTVGACSINDNKSPIWARGDHVVRAIQDHRERGSKYPRIHSNALQSRKGRSCLKARPAGESLGAALHARAKQFRHPGVKLEEFVSFWPVDARSCREQVRLRR